MQKDTPRQPRRPAPGTALLLVAGAMLLVLVASLLRVTLAAGHNLDALVVTPAPSPAPVEPAPPALLRLPTLPSVQPDAVASVTVLLLGSDRRPGEDVTPRSDAIMVARIDPTRGRVALLSLPRDLYVSIPGHGRNRLNAAYLWGERDGPAGGGMALARATVGELLHTPIDYVAVVDFRGFAALVDALGGITVEVEQALIDERFPTAARGTTTVRFAAGSQRMDGVTALTYTRVRHPDGDLQRGQRQQAVLLAIAQRLRERDDLANLLALEHISAALVGYVQTDLPRERMLELAWALRNLDAASVERYSFHENELRVGVGADRFALTAEPGTLERVTRLLLLGPEQ